MTKLLSIRDAATATGLTPKALRRRIERGTISSVVVNGRRRIAMEELFQRGLLVPLDAEGRPQAAVRPALRAPTPPSAFAERLRALERRVVTLEAEVARLRRERRP